LTGTYGPLEEVSQTWQDVHQPDGAILAGSAEFVVLGLRRQDSAAGRPWSGRGCSAHIRASGRGHGCRQVWWLSARIWNGVRLPVRLRLEVAAGHFAGGCPVASFGDVAAGGGG
jgi:hypothetical protein